MLATTLGAASLARKAYAEFPEHPPHQMADGSLKVFHYGITMYS